MKIRVVEGTGMDELIARLEAATGPSRAIDRDIAELLNLPMPPEEYWPPRYTQSIEDVALTLVPEGSRWQLRNSEEKIFGYFAVVWGAQSTWDQHGATPAIALCIASLRARKAIAEARVAEEQRGKG